MGIELPAELAGIAERTGAQWPEADEDAMQTQAVAWQEAAKGLRSLASDADASANGALEGMSGAAGDQARKAWSGFVDADSGSLTTAAQGADQAADRLEHAAQQIGEGKTEIVRQLVDAARNEEAARASADGGHPQALLGVPSLLGAVSTNLASVTESLAGSVADTGRAVDATVQVDPNPGSHGQGGHSGGGLLAAVSGLATDATSGVTDTVDGAADEVLDTGNRADIPEVEPPGASLPDAAGRPAEVSPDAPTPPAGLAAGGNPAAGSFAETPTPRTGIPAVQADVARPPGQTTLAGFVDAPVAPAGPPPAAAPPLPGAGASQAQTFAPLGGPHGAGPVGPPPAGAVPGGGPPAGGAGGSAAGQAPAPAKQATDAPNRPEQQKPETRRPEQQKPETRRPEPQRPEARQPEPPRPAQQQPAVGTPRSDRAGVVALFLVHMFPIGHLPVATREPARQLPPPEQGVDPFAALRFEPHDHPQSAVFDDAEADPGRAVDTAGLAVEHPAVASMFEVYDSLAGQHERDWDRRYLVKHHTESPEYAWPPGEVYPEGCYEDGEPVMLEPGTVIDRFGGSHGRVFGEDGTAYHKRSLPPPGSAEYRRYRVVLELPVWRGIVVPWFGQPGSAVRYRTVYPARDLVVLGYLEDITAQTEQQAGETA